MYTSKINNDFCEWNHLFWKEFSYYILLHIQFIKSWKIFFASDLWKNDFIISIQLNHANKSPKMKFFFEHEKKREVSINSILNWIRCSEWKFYTKNMPAFFKANVIPNLLRKNTPKHTLNFFKKGFSCYAMHRATDPPVPLWSICICIFFKKYLLCTSYFIYKRVALL